MNISCINRDTRQLTIAQKVLVGSEVWFKVGEICILTSYQFEDQYIILEA